MIYGNSIGSTHNYKGMRRIWVCHSETWRCKRSGQEVRTDQLECPECGQPTVERELRIAPYHAREKMPKHIFGVETKDHRFVWFKEPLHPQPWLVWLAQEESKPND